MRAALLALTTVVLAATAHAAKFDPAAIYKVPAGSGPTRGPADARVTIVAFLDFQCPYCVRALPALDSMLRRYPEDVRLVIRHRPLSMHPQAAPAARAAIAAARQGLPKFWRFHDLLWEAGPSQLGDAAFEAAALRAGLDVPRWKKDVASDAVAKVLAADEAVADALGVTGTPTFFVNGRAVVGAPPVEAFDALIVEARGRADAVIAKGTARAKVYDAVVAGGRARGEDAVAAGGALVATEAKAVPIAGAPARGPVDAPITIVEFTDFQCPYCLKAQATLAEVQRRYAGKVRLVFRHFPLDFHADAFTAAEAATFADGEGAFWGFHDAIFAKSKELERASLEKRAAELGLDVVRLRLALDTGRYEARVAADMDLGVQLGVTGTPAFFVNGRMVSGAQPVETFVRLIDEELAKVAALRKQGVSADKIYAKLVGLPADAKPAPAAARPPAEVEHALATVAACYAGRVEQARTALAKLKGPRRASVLADCKALGVTLE